MRRCRSISAGACVLVVSTLLTACSADGSRPVADEDPPSVSPTTSSPSPRPAPPTGWTPLEEDQEGAVLSPGRYGLFANGRSDVPWAVVDVPQGFSNLGDWAMFDERTEGSPALGYWTVSEVDRDPCLAGEDDPMEAGDSVEDLVTVLGRQRRTIMTRPVPTRLDGHSGVYLEIQVPPDLDVRECAGLEYLVWESDPEGARHMETPGTRDRLWILDVDGAVVVLNATAEPGALRGGFDRVTRVVESVEFVSWP